MPWRRSHRASRPKANRMGFLPFAQVKAGWIVFPKKNGLAKTAWQSPVPWLQLVQFSTAQENCCGTINPRSKSDETVAPAWKAEDRRVTCGKDCVSFLSKDCFTSRNRLCYVTYLTLSETS